MRFLVVDSVLDSGVSLFGDRLSDTLVSGERDEGLGALAEEEDVGGSRGKGVASRVLDVDDVETTRVSLSGLDGTDSPDVLTADDLADVTGLELDPVGDLGRVNVQLDAVANPYIGVGVSEGSSVVCDEKGDVVLGSLDLLDSAELVSGLLSADSVYHESALGVIDKSKVLVGLVNSDDIHESSGVLAISPDLAVNLDHTAHQDLLALLAGKGVVESVSDENGQWEAFSELVRAGIGSE